MWKKPPQILNWQLFSSQKKVCDVTTMSSLWAKNIFTRNQDVLGRTFSGPKAQTAGEDHDQFKRFNRGERAVAS